MAFKAMWDEVPKPLQIIVYTILGIVAAFGLGLLFGWVVVWLWNWLMPMIFGLPAITFWQGVGIVILSKILFGGFSSHGDSSKSSKRTKEKNERDYECDSGWFKGKIERWEHYDEWWKAEGKALFEKFADRADAGAASGGPGEDEKPAAE